MGESFCQLVRNHLRGCNVLEIDLSSSHFITNVVMLNVNIFCLSILDIVVSKGDRSLIVTFKRDRDVCSGLEERFCRSVDVT